MSLVNRMEWSRGEGHLVYSKQARHPRCKPQVACCDSGTFSTPHHVRATTQRTMQITGYPGLVWAAIVSLVCHQLIDGVSDSGLFEPNGCNTGVFPHGSTHFPVPVQVTQSPVRSIHFLRSI